MNITQDAFARRFGVGQPQVNKLVRGILPAGMRRSLEILRAAEEFGGVSRLHLLYPEDFDPAGNPKHPSPTAQKKSPDFVQVRIEENSYEQ